MMVATGKYPSFRQLAEAIRGGVKAYCIFDKEEVVVTSEPGRQGDVLFACNEWEFVDLALEGIGVDVERA
jgi:hypothetical protein